MLYGAVRSNYIRNGITRPANAVRKTISLCSPKIRACHTDIGPLGSSKDDYDIVIVGGGLVGATMACAIGSTPILKNLRVCLIESAPAVLNPPIPAQNIDTQGLSRAPDMRVVSINPVNAKLFSDIGVWQLLEKGDLLENFLDNPSASPITNTSEDTATALRTSSKQGNAIKLEKDVVGGPTAFTEMKVWEGDFASNVHFSSSELGIPALGYLIENNAIQRGLYRRLEAIQKSGKLDIFCPDKVELVSHPVHPRGHPQPQKSYGQDKSVVLKTSSGKQLRTGLLIAADGANSPIRQKCEIPTSGASYNTMGLVTVLKHRRHSYTAYQKFLSDHGIIAILPMWENYSSLVWSTTAPACEILSKMDSQQFVDVLNDQLRSSPSMHGLSQVSDFLISKLNTNAGVDSAGTPTDLPYITEIVGPRAAFPLSTKSAQRYVLPGIALIGDAGHVVHPLAGQGVNLGLQDVVSLTNSIADAIYSGHTCDSWMALDAYEKERYSHNTISALGIDFIEKTFRTDLTPLKVARSIGFSFVNQVNPLKNILANVAIGETPFDIPNSKSHNPHKLKFL